MKQILMKNCLFSWTKNCTIDIAKSKNNIAKITTIKDVADFVYQHKIYTNTQ